jgi:hypothetical protein
LCHFKLLLDQVVFVPGLDMGGCGWKLVIVGGIQGLDRVFAIYFRVLRVKVLDLVVMVFFILVLPVKVHPQPLE